MESMAKRVFEQLWLIVAALPGTVWSEDSHWYLGISLLEYTYSMYMSARAIKKTGPKCMVYCMCLAVGFNTVMSHLCCSWFQQLSKGWQLPIKPYVAQGLGILETVFSNSFCPPLNIKEMPAESFHLFTSKGYGASILYRECISVSPEVCIAPSQGLYRR